MTRVWWKRSLVKTNVLCVFHTVNTMVADGLETQSARATHGDGQRGDVYTAYDGFKNYG